SARRWSPRARRTTPARRPSGRGTTWRSCRPTALLAQSELARERRPDAVRQEHDDEQHHDAVEHLLDARNLPAQGAEDLRDAVGEDGQHRRAEDRAEQGADAADDRPEDDLNRAADVEDLLRKQ